MKLLCFILGHQPYCDSREYPFIRCFRCPMPTLQEWYPDLRKNWTIKP